MGKETVTLLESNTCHHSPSHGYVLSSCDVHSFMSFHHTLVLNPSSPPPLLFTTAQSNAAAIPNAATSTPGFVFPAAALCELVAVLPELVVVPVPIAPPVTGVAVTFALLPVAVPFTALLLSTTAAEVGSLPVPAEVVAAEPSGVKSTTVPLGYS
jgi:hypothetical protein